jgi:hypothetical protein
MCLPHGGRVVVVEGDPAHLAEEELRVVVPLVLCGCAGTVNERASREGWQE